MTEVADTLDAFINEIDSRTRDRTMRAARGECSWVCADCCAGFSNGMPDECAYGHQGCTETIRRDKADAKKAKREDV